VSLDLDLGDSGLRREQPLGLGQVVHLDEQRRIAARRDLCDWALQDHMATVDDRHLVASLLDLVEQVRREKDGAALVDERADQVARLEDARWIETVHRLVENQEQRVCEQAACDSQALPHAERIRLHAVVCAVGEPDARKRWFDAAVGGAVAGGRDDLEVLAAGEVRMELRFLDDRADAGQGLSPLRGLRQPEQAEVAGRGARETEQGANERRLARSVRSEETECRPGRHGQVDVVDRGSLAESLRQPLRLDDRIHGPQATGSTQRPTTRGAYGGASR